MKHSDRLHPPAYAPARATGVLSWQWDRDVRPTGLAHDPIRARWHEEHLTRARRDDVSAQFMVGFHYEKGYGVARDYAEAYRWYAIANSHGYAPAALAWFQRRRAHRAATTPA